jgi:hypothetical protein
MGDLSEKKSGALSIAKTTAIGTVAIGAIALQIIVFRAVGDIMTSVALFGLGYMACSLRK